MRKMDYNKLGNRNTRVYHLPLDGYTETLDTLDFQTRARFEEDRSNPTPLPFWIYESFSVPEDRICGPSSLSNSSSVGDYPSSLPFSLSNSSSVSSQECHYGLGPGPDPTWLPFSLIGDSNPGPSPGPSPSFSLSNSSSKSGQNGPSSLPFSLSISSSVDDQSESNYSINFSLSNSSSVNDRRPSSLPFSLSNSSSENDQEGPSLPFWMMSKSSSVGNKSEADTNRLLGESNSKNHQISEGKRFMRPDIFEKIPDLLHELSFRDIIDDDLATYAYVEGDIIIEGETLNEPIKNVKLHPAEIRRKKMSSGQIITKNQSMNSAGFLLKMFVPLSLLSKTKSRNCSKIIPGTSFDLIENIALSKQLSQRLLHKNKSKGIDGFTNITTQKRLVGGKFLSCFCKMSDSQRYIGNALLNDGCNK